MEKIASYGVPLLAHLTTYQGETDNTIGMTFLWIFTIDIDIGRKNLGLVLGVGPLYIQLGWGVL